MYTHMHKHARTLTHAHTHTHTLEITGLSEDNTQMIQLIIQA